MAVISINRVVLVGNLTRDPELRALPNGTTVCHLRLACNASRRDREGNWEARPNFFDVSVFGAPAQNASRFLHKGRAVAIDGRLEWREWETADHQKRQAVNIVAENVQFLGAPDRSRRDAADAEAAKEPNSEAASEANSEAELEPVGASPGLDTEAEDDLTF